MIQNGASRKNSEGSVMDEIKKRINNLKVKIRKADQKIKRGIEGYQENLNPVQETINQKLKEVLVEVINEAEEHGGHVEKQVQIVIEKKLSTYREEYEQSSDGKCVQELQKYHVDTSDTIMARLRQECKNMINLNSQAEISTLHPAILKCIEDLQKLLTALVSGSSLEASYDQTIDLVNLMYCGSLFSKKAERIWVSENLQGQRLTEEHLFILSNLSHIISPPPSVVHLPAQPIYHKNSLEVCVTHAKNLVLKSGDEFPGSNLSYAELNDKVKAIISSAYIKPDTTVGHVIEPDFSTANIKIFWDFENCTIPANNRARNIAKNIQNLLRKSNYNGPYDIHGYGSNKQIAKEKMPIICGQNIKIHNVPPHGTKDAADKKIIVETMVWVYEQLVEYHEPQVVMLITSDVDFSWAMDEVRSRNFKLILVHNQNVGFELTKHADENHLWSVIV